jgi:hypothetical protein
MVQQLNFADVFVTDLGWIASIGRDDILKLSIDAAIYGFIANIYFLEIDTPRKKFVVAHGLVRHCTAIHAAIG